MESQKVPFLKKSGDGLDRGRTRTRGWDGYRKNAESSAEKKFSPRSRAIRAVLRVAVCANYGASVVGTVQVVMWSTQTVLTSPNTVVVCVCATKPSLLIKQYPIPTPAGNKGTVWGLTCTQDGHHIHGPSGYMACSCCGGGRG